MRKGLYWGLGLLILVAGLGAYWFFQLPRTAEDFLQRAKNIEKKCSAKMVKLQQLPDSAKAERETRKLKDKIITAYTEVVRRFPDMPQAVEAEYKLIKLADEWGEAPDKLAELYEEFRKKHPDSPYESEVIKRLAELHHQQLKQPLQAIEYYKQYMKKFPDQEFAADAIFQMGKIYEDIKEFERAAQTYKELVKRFPTSAMADEAQFRTAQLYADQLKKRQLALQSLEKLEKEFPTSKYVVIGRAKKQSLYRQEMEEQEGEYYHKYYKGIGETSPIAQLLQSYDDPAAKEVRKQNLKVMRYEIKLNLEPERAYLSYETGLTLKPTREMNNLVVQLNPDLIIKEIKIAGEPVEFKRKDKLVYILLSQPIEQDKEIRLDVAYSFQGQKLYGGDVVTTSVVYLRPESEWLPQVSYGDYFQCACQIELPGGWQAIVPGELIDSIETDNRAVVKWQSKQPVCMLAIAAGPFDAFSRTMADGTKLSCYYYAAHKQGAELIMAETEAILNFFSQRFGSLPYDHLAIVEVSHLRRGYSAPGFILLPEQAFVQAQHQLAEYQLAHQLSHQWWVHKVGLDLRPGSVPWLCEGFAAYSDALYLEHKEGAKVMAQHVKQLNSFYFQRLLHFADRPIKATWWTDPMYPSLIYQKGAIVLHVLRKIMGDDKFFQALRSYTDNYKFQSVTVSDFQRCCEQVYGESLDWFFTEWLERKGLPHLKIEAAQAAINSSGKYELKLQLHQIDAVFTLPVDISIYYDDERLVKTIWLKEGQQELSFTLPEKPVRVILDENNWLLKYPEPQELEKEVTVKP